MAGVVFGILFGELLHRSSKGGEPVLADMSWRQRRAVQRAASRGPVPSEPDERRRAYRLVAVGVSWFVDYHRIERRSSCCGPATRGS